jgi:hypothetical protein
MDFFKDTTLAPSSVTMLNRKLNEWISFFPEHQQNVLSILMFPENANKILLENLKNKANTNLHNFYTAINAFSNHSVDFISHIPLKQLNELKSQWCKIRKDNQAPIVERREQQLPTDNQLKKGGIHVKYEDVINKRDSLQFGSIEKLLLGFYTYLPPVRADYFAVEIITFKQKPTLPNFIRRVSPTHSVITINDFKTHERYSKITHILPLELNNELVESLRIKPRKYLFVNQTDQPFTRNSFSKWTSRILSRLFETEFTLNILRHLFINTLDMSKSPHERKQISDKMGHHYNTQMLYKWDLSKIDSLNETSDQFDDE